MYKTFVFVLVLLATAVSIETTRQLLAAAPPPASRPQPIPDLGPGADMHGYRPFPDDDPWNKDISKEPVDPMSDAIVRHIGIDKQLHGDFGSRGGGIPYIVVGKDQKPIQVKFTTESQSADKGPYPIPLNAAIEGNGRGDAHVLCVDRDAQILYELYQGKHVPNGWQADYGAIFDMKITSMQRAEGRTSCDAAGLPIFPGLVRYDEVVLRRKIEHAIRFTVSSSRKDWVSPARHQAGSSDKKEFPPMGMRVRLKANYDISRFPPMDQVILTCLKTYGMIVADNGSDWYMTGAPDSRWNDQAISALHNVKGKDFEVIRMEDPAADQK